MKKQLSIFLNAILYFTRIPVPVKVEYSEEIMNRSMRYFPFVGWVMGAVGAGVYWGLSFIVPEALALLLSMLATIFVSGAFHEDGFADFCDGFGGGYTKEKVLDIMKDSRIGTYGSIGLMGILATKFTSLYSIHDLSVPLILLAGHSLSRLMPVLLIYTSVYARKDDSSKSRAIAHKGRYYDFLMALFFGLALQVLMPLAFVACIIPVLLAVTFVFRAYTNKRLGGYTGDCLGALQQIVEVVFYTGLVIYQTIIT
jgi:adenosylcobinamide-GDP ribazoletransferase